VRDVQFVKYCKEILEKNMKIMKGMCSDYEYYQQLDNGLDEELLEDDL